MKAWCIEDEAGARVYAMPLADVLDPSMAARGRVGFGVYEAIGAAGDVLYTGRTGDLAARLRQHLHLSAWWGFAVEIRWTPCANYAESVALERLGISSDRGDWNVAGVAALPASRDVLPASAAHRLVGLYAATATDPHGNVDFDNYVATLRQAGWTLAAIAAPLNITRERIRQRADHGTVDHDLVVPIRPRPEGRRKKFWPRISERGKAEMADLQRQASLVRGPTPVDHPHRAASERLAELMADAKLRGVRDRDIAAAAGVSVSAVRLRLARHGYVTRPASVAPYRAGFAPTREPQAKCQRGHDLSGDNLRLINGDPKRRICRACERIRVAKYRAKFANQSPVASQAGEARGAAGITQGAAS